MKQSGDNLFYKNKFVGIIFGLYNFSKENKQWLQSATAAF